MPYNRPGDVITVVASKPAVHGQAVIENGIPGIAHKAQQLTAFVDPASAAATQIAIGEEFEESIDGLVEVARSGNLATADVGAGNVSDIYIKESDNTLGMQAQGLTTPALTAGWRKFGKVVERDATRTPQVLRISLDMAYAVKGNDA